MDVILNCACFRSQYGSYNSNEREQLERLKRREHEQRRLSELQPSASSSQPAVIGLTADRCASPAQGRIEISEAYDQIAKLQSRRLQGPPVYSKKYASIDEESLWPQNQSDCSTNEEDRTARQLLRKNENLNPVHNSDHQKIIIHKAMGNSVKSKQREEDSSSSQASSSSARLDKNETSRSKPSSDEPVLSSFTLEGISELINENKIGKSSVIVLVGAGMSTSAGVPDFRSPDMGIYANLQKYNLPHPEDVFKIDYFKNNPAPFYDLSRTLLPKKLYPTLAHYFVKLLDDKGYLLRCFSQNVDCLESLSGVPKDKLCLAHGSFETGHCLRCNAEYTLAWMRQIVEQGGIPHCVKTQDCKGLVKPDIKFFGERLDGRFFRLVKEDFPKCELLIIIGSSLTVMPFAQLVQKVPPRCPRLLINKTKSGHNIPAIFRIFRSNNGLMYDRKGNTRDVAYLGDCDEACQKLATLLGWQDELLAMAEQRRRQLETGGES